MQMAPSSSRACLQVTGYGGTTQVADAYQAEKMVPVASARPIRVSFSGTTSDSYVVPRKQKALCRKRARPLLGGALARTRPRLLSPTRPPPTHSRMPWTFKPEQQEVSVVPGETALAFYKAYNPTRRPITGVSTYNVTPMKAGLYFNKIQCFCFEEQRLKPREEVDMPVFFYIDPAILDDPQMRHVTDITLSYTFFKTVPSPPPCCNASAHAVLELCRFRPPHLTPPSTNRRHALDHRHPPPLQGEEEELTDAQIQALEAANPAHAAPPSK